MCANKFLITGSTRRKQNSRVAFADFHGAHSPTWPILTHQCEVTERGIGKEIYPIGFCEPHKPAIAENWKYLIVFKNSSLLSYLTNLGE